MPGGRAHAGIAFVVGFEPGVLELVVEAHVVHALEDLVAVPVQADFPAVPDACERSCFDRHRLVLSGRSGGRPEVLRYPKIAESVFSAPSSCLAIMFLTSVSSGVSGRRTSSRSGATSGRYLTASAGSFGPVV